MSGRVWSITLIVVSILISFNIITAQDIVGKLGGTTANETYDITDSGDNLLFRVQGDGKVGIGTTNPLSRLSVGGEGHVSTAIYGKGSIGGVSGYATTGTGVSGESEWTTGSGIQGRATHTTGVNFGVFGSTDSPNGWAGYFQGRGYFSGNVGIGTNNPETKLHISGLSGENTPTYGAGTLFAVQQNSSSNWVDMAITASRSGAASINFGDYDNYHIGSILYHNSDNSMHFNTNTSEKVRITSTGNVGIGTTTPGAKLSIVGLSEYTNNAAALAASLTVGDLYRSGDVLKIVH